MTRQGFVNTLDMRDKLRANYQAMHQEQTVQPKSESAAPATENPTVPEENAGDTPKSDLETVPQETESYVAPESRENPDNDSPHPELPVLPRGEQQDYERDYRDLEGRILYDLAMTEVREQQLDTERNNLAAYRDILEKIKQELQRALLLGEKLDRRCFNNLSSAYFSAAGKFKGERNITAESPNANKEIKSVSLWPVAGAIVFTGLLLALVLALLFG